MFTIHAQSVCSKHTHSAVVFVFEKSVRVCDRHASMSRPSSNTVLCPQLRGENQTNDDLDRPNGGSLLASLSRVFFLLFSYIDRRISNEFSATRSMCV